MATQVNSQDEDIRLIAYKLSQLEMHLGRLDEKLEELMKIVMSTPKCPKPGLCVALEERVKLDEKSKDEVFKRLNEIERKVSYADGVGRGALILVSLLSSLATGLVMFVVSRLFQ